MTQLPYPHVHCPVLGGLKLTSFQHHNENFDVTIENRDYDVTKSTVMQLSRVLLVHLNWTCDRKIESNERFLIRVTKQKVFRLKQKLLEAKT